MADHRLINFLVPVIDSEVQLRRHVLWLLLIRVIFFTLLLGITTLLQSKGHTVILPPTSIILAFLSVIFIYSIGSAAVLQVGSLHVRRFGIIQLLSDTFFAALLVYGTGCSQSIFTPVFILPVIAGGLILYRIGGLIPAAAATILYGIVLTIEYFNFLPTYFTVTPYTSPHDPLAGTNLFAVYGLTFFLTALLSGMLAGRLRTAEQELSRTSLEFDRLSQLYKQIFDDISTGIITTDDRDIISSYNQAAERITGRPAHDVIGKNFHDRFPEILLEEKTGRHVADLKKSATNMIRIGYSFSQLNMPTDPSLDKSDITNSRVITLQDISKIEHMEHQVREAEKMAAIGELSASIAHDFRNPLAAISGSAQIMAMDQEANPASVTKEKQTLTGIILRECDRMAKTINEFLQFARPAPLQQEWFDLKRLAEETIRPITALPGRHPHCRIHLDIPQHLDCWADKQQIQTVLTHLLENSCLATSRTDEPIVIRGREDSRSGTGVICIEVVDQGVGIGAEVRKKILTPFFSTRANSTGLGLSIVKQIVEHHGGELEILSEPDKGCTVRIFLRLPNPDKPELKVKS